MKMYIWHILERESFYKNVYLAGVLEREGCLHLLQYQGSAQPSKQNQIFWGKTYQVFFLFISDYFLLWQLMIISYCKFLWYLKQRFLKMCNTILVLKKISNAKYIIKYSDKKCLIRE